MKEESVGNQKSGKSTFDNKILVDYVHVSLWLSSWTPQIQIQQFQILCYFKLNPTSLIQWKNASIITCMIAYNYMY